MASESHMFSSPVRGAHDASLITVSSSPEFPSISDLLAKTAAKPPLRSGSRAAPIPETGFKSFTTATDLWRSNLDDFENDGFLRDVSEVAKRSQETRRESPAPTTVVSHSVTVVTSEVQCAVSAPTEAKVQPTKAKRVYKPRAKKTATSEAPVDGEVPPKPKPRRKTKEKDTSDGQTTLPKGKVTKATGAKPKQTKKRAETVSKHFPAAAEAPVESIEIDDPIELEPALARRIDWTPTKDTVSHIFLLDSSTTKEAIPFGLSSAVSSLQPRKDLFTNLRDTYGCADEEEKRKASPPPGEPVDILGKRKLIEMVTTGGSTTPEVSPTKPQAKAAKKKPRTITELATAAYRVPEIVEDPVKEDESLLNYFTVEQDSVSGENEKKKVAAGKSKTTKSGAKPKPKRATKKKAAVPQPILLSPTSALRQVSRQDFVFGTSSQLATEQDAGLLRDIQLAMKASNQQEDDTPFASSPVNISVARKSSGNRLWGAGARDEFGDLLQVEVIDLVDSPAIPKDLTNPEVILSLVEPPKAPQLGIEQMVVPPAVPTAVNTTDLSSSLTSQTPAQPTSHFFSTQRKTITASVPATINSITTALPPTSSVLLADFDWDDEPPASNQEQFHLMASQAVKSPPKVVDSPTVTEAVEPASVALAVEDAVPVPAVPKYESCTDEQLAREIKRYGFKPIKRRAAAIALLTECWMSKNKSKVAGVAQAQGTTASMSTTSNTAAKAATPAAASAPAAPRPRGRPKKDTSTAPLISADLSASVPAEAAKKPRGRPKKDASTGVSTTAKTTSKRTAKASSLPPPSELAAEGIARPSTPKRRKISPPRYIIEIADSDAEDLNPFLSSPSASPSLSPEPANEFSSPPTADTSMTEDDSLTLTPTSDQAALFGLITDAVKTAPRSTDPENPSWHEKMLMYDPVVLEDLTAWLNGGQLDRVGWDGEVSTADVKKWCESRSVCCLWKVTNNGKDRARY